MSIFIDPFFLYYTIFNLHILPASGKEAFFWFPHRFPDQKPRPRRPATAVGGPAILGRPPFESEKDRVSFAPLSFFRISFPFGFQKGRGKAVHAAALLSSGDRKILRRVSAVQYRYTLRFALERIICEFTASVSGQNDAFFSAKHMVHILQLGAMFTQSGHLRVVF